LDLEEACDEWCPEIFQLCEDNFFQLHFAESCPLYDESPYQEDLEEATRSLGIGWLPFHEALPLYDESYNEQSVFVEVEVE